MPAPLVLLDSITQVRAEHAGAVVVTGSHGGLSVVPYAQAVRARLYVFNDAGIGKDDAGVAALAVLDAHGQAAVAVAHTSARIGEARETLDSGVVSRVNGAASALGLRVGAAIRAALAPLDA